MFTLFGNHSAARADNRRTSPVADPSVQRAARHGTSGDSDRASAPGKPMEKTRLIMRSFQQQRTVRTAGELLSQFGVEEFADRGLQQKLPEIISCVRQCLAHQVAANRAVALQQRGKCLVGVGSSGQRRGGEPKPGRPAFSVNP